MIKLIRVVSSNGAMLSVRDTVTITIHIINSRKRFEAHLWQVAAGRIYSPLLIQ